MQEDSEMAMVPEWEEVSPESEAVRQNVEAPSLAQLMARNLEGSVEGFAAACRCRKCIHWASSCSAADHEVCGHDLPAMELESLQEQGQCTPDEAPDDNWFLFGTLHDTPHSPIGRRRALSFEMTTPTNAM